MSSKDNAVSRRAFVALTALGGTLTAAGCGPQAQDAWEFLTSDQARTLKAVCDTLIPEDDYPSASQLGVLTYIDRQLARHYRRHRDSYRDGLAAIDNLSRKLYGHDMAALNASQQAELIEQFERDQRKTFELFRSHTLEGYYGAPRHGGNRDATSWKMLQLDEPPLRGRAQYNPRKEGDA
jgi:gluconate 2-dehydrogenase gamma chain